MTLIGKCRAVARGARVSGERAAGDAAGRIGGRAVCIIMLTAGAASTSEWLVTGGLEMAEFLATSASQRLTLVLDIWRYSNLAGGTSKVKPHEREIRHHRIDVQFRRRSINHLLREIGVHGLIWTDTLEFLKHRNSLVKNMRSPYITQTQQ